MQLIYIYIRAMSKSHRTPTAARHQQDNLSKVANPPLTIKMTAKLEGHKTRNNKTMTKQRIPHKQWEQQRINRTKLPEWAAAQATGRGGGLNAFYQQKTFALASIIVKGQNLISSHGGFQTIALHHHRETKLIYGVHFISINLRTKFIYIVS